MKPRHPETPPPPGVGPLPHGLRPSSQRPRSPLLPHPQGHFALRSLSGITIHPLCGWVNGSVMPSLTPGKAWLERPSWGKGFYHPIPRSPWFIGEGRGEWSHEAEDLTTPWCERGCWLAVRGPHCPPGLCPGLARGAPSRSIASCNASRAHGLSRCGRARSAGPPLSLLDSPCLAVFQSGFKK